MIHPGVYKLSYKFITRMVNQREKSSALRISQDKLEIWIIKTNMVVTEWDDHALVVFLVNF